MKKFVKEFIKTWKEDWKFILQLAGLFFVQNLCIYLLIIINK